MLLKKILFSLGFPFSPAYSLVMKARATLYKKSFFKQHKFSVPIISVGNLTMGGTGKTPTVLHIASILQKEGFKPAIISRGYGGKSTKQINVVSDMESLRMTPQQAGDEPYMLASMLPGVPVLTGKKRTLTINFAINEFHSDVLILDDGFQHHAVTRDLDIVLFDEATGLGNGRVFPGGDLREPLSALDRSSFFLITGQCASGTSKQSDIEIYLRSNWPNIEIFFSKRNQGLFFSAHEKTEHGREMLPEKILAFCGIANPRRLRDDLLEYGFDVRFFKSYPDHHQYTQSEISFLTEKARSVGARAIITTDKDLVKIGTRSTTDLPIYSVRPQTNFNELFDKRVIDIASGKKTGTSHHFS